MRLSAALLVSLGALHVIVAASDCKSKSVCGKCIADADCAWCSDIVLTDDKHRCQSSSPLQWCSNETYYPLSRVDILTNKGPGPNNQISPQKVKISARPGQKSHFEVEYMQTSDPPLDLYYMMDLSDSMNDDKERLSALGNELAARMKDKSNNLRMGFGSFVDKRTMPYTNILRKNMIPCKNCVPTYAFKNHLALTNNTNQFARSVGETKTSGNVDYPEGGLDALMQAMVCTKEIGWRDDSLRMIIFSTDSECHFAGDGKLAGIVEPNDEQCHMQDGNYTYDLEQDYPSVAQIRRVASRENMRIVFAVTENVLHNYYELGWIISAPRNMTGLLTKDSGNVIKLIEDAYDSLTQRVVIIAEHGQDVSVMFKSNCLNKTGNQRKTNTCDIKKSGDRVKFDVTVKVKTCPADTSQRKQNITIKPDIAMKHELVVELEIICECDCETSGIPHHAECNGNGNLTCGTCVCDKGYGGKYCSCETDSQDFDDDDFSACQQNKDGIVCSKRGECICQECECNSERYYGDFCECDSESCPRGLDDKVCSGNGICECNEMCSCHQGWKGKSCACTTSEESCKNSYGEVCSGRGQCECGVCKCDSTQDGGRYTGDFCDDCLTCKGKCDELQQCVEYQVFKPDGLDAPECNNLNYDLHKVDDLTDMVISEALKGHHMRKRESNLDVEALPHPKASGAARFCSYPDRQGCTYNFKYITVDKRLHVFATESKECGEPLDLMAVVLGLVGAIVIAGVVMLIIWKVATTIHDRQEFRKFEKEREAAMFGADNNPLYKAPGSTFQNPTFGLH